MTAAWRITNNRAQFLLPGNRFGCPESTGQSILSSHPAILAAASVKLSPGDLVYSHREFAYSFFQDVIGTFERIYPLQFRLIGQRPDTTCLILA